MSRSQKYIILRNNEGLQDFMKRKRAVKYSQCFVRPQRRNPNGKPSGPAPRLSKIYRQKASSGVVVLGGTSHKIRIWIWTKIVWCHHCGSFWFGRNNTWFLKELLTLHNTATTQYGSAGVSVSSTERAGAGGTGPTGPTVSHPPYLKLWSKVGVRCRTGL